MVLLIKWYIGFISDKQLMDCNQYLVFVSGLESQQSQQSQDENNNDNLGLYDPQQAPFEINVNNHAVQNNGIVIVPSTQQGKPNLMK